MKKRWFFFLLASFLTVALLPSCKTKSGCQATESLKASNEKKISSLGKKKGSKNDLFPKKMKKKM